MFATSLLEYFEWLILAAMFQTLFRLRIYLCMYAKGSHESLSDDGFATLPYDVHAMCLFLTTLLLSSSLSWFVVVLLAILYCTVSVCPP